jgi:hypothetical protein
MRRVIIFAVVAVAAAVALVGPSAGAKPKPVKPGQFVTYTCAAGETAGSGTVAWFDKNGKVISITQATASGATLTAGPAPDRTKAYEWSRAICIPPTTTTVAPTTTTVADPTIHLAGSFTYPTDGEPRYIYGGDPSLGFPVCEAGTSLNLDASVIGLPPDVTLINFLDQEIPSLIVEIPYIDVTGNGDYETRTITYDYACEPA